MSKIIKITPDPIIEQKTLRPALITFDCNGQIACHDILIIMVGDTWANIENSLQKEYPTANMTEYVLLNFYRKDVTL